MSNSFNDPILNPNIKYGKSVIEQLNKYPVPRNEYENWEKVFTERKKEMNKFEEIKDFEKVIYVIPAFGHSKETISIKAERDKDVKVNTLHITKKKPNLETKILEKFVFEESFSISVDKAYNVKTATIKVENGLVLIEVKTDSDRLVELVAE